MQFLRVFLFLGSSAFASAASLRAAPQCAPCMAMANKLLATNCNEPVCAVKAFAAKKDAIMNSKDGPMQLMAVYGCAQQQNCDLMPAEAAAKELGLMAPSLFQLNSVPAQTHPASPTATGGPVKR